MDERRRSDTRNRAFAACVGVVFLLAVLSTSARAEDALPAPRRDGLPTVLVPVGQAIGVKLFADGVLVVKLSEGDTPAKASGLRAGDVVTSFNGTEIESTEHLLRLIAENGEAQAAMSVRRGAGTLTLRVTPAEGEDGVCRLGAWIRDSMAGIGTMTFYDPETGLFGALGHGVTDVDTGALMPLERGGIMEASVKAVKRGERGAPGELRGDFDLTHDCGTLCANTECGVFGALTDTTGVGALRGPVPVAAGSAVHPGPATILANCGGSEVKEYAVEIERVYGGGATRNFLLRVTDEALLACTGGIVQGMSGSPVLQDGKFVGAVTHVLVNDAARGYGIFLENMLRAAG